MKTFKGTSTTQPTTPYVEIQVVDDYNVPVEGAIIVKDYINPPHGDDDISLSGGAYTTDSEGICIIPLAYNQTFTVSKTGYQSVKSIFTGSRFIEITLNEIVVPPTDCPESYIWNGTECVPRNECPNGYRWNGTECVPVTVINPPPTSNAGILSNISNTWLIILGAVGLGFLLKSK